MLRSGCRGAPAASRCPPRRTSAPPPRACPCGRGTSVLPRSLHASQAQVLDFQPLVDAVLGALAADAGLLDAAERGDFGRDDAGVDAEDAVLQRLRDAPDAADVAAVEVARQAVRR